MSTHVQVDLLSREEKLRLIDEIWASLLQEPDALPVPEWHHEILADRLDRVQKGETSFVDWEEAKVQIRKVTE